MKVIKIPISKINIAKYNPRKNLNQNDKEYQDERAGILGGEGFSWGDIQMNLTGIVTHRIGVLIWNRWKYHRWNLNKISK